MQVTVCPSVELHPLTGPALFLRPSLEQLFTCRHRMRLRKDSREVILFSSETLLSADRHVFSALRWHDLACAEQRNRRHPWDSDRFIWRGCGRGYGFSPERKH